MSSSREAAIAGRAILEAGGNAIDAAVATAFALSVTQPFSTGLGGGAFILAREVNGSVYAIDCRETAPAAATRDMYIKEDVPEKASVFGPLAVATPGLVKGLLVTHEKWGKLPRSQVMAPAIRLAREGFEIGPYHARTLSYMRPHLTVERFPETARIQFPPAGEPIYVGWRLVQTDLADTLEQIAEGGVDAFYRGPIAEAIADHVQNAGGILTLEDLAQYQVKYRDPVSGTYRGLAIHSFPPPSSGGVVLLQVLNILEGWDDLAERGAGSSASVHLIAEAMKLAFADRAAYMGDPDFVDLPVSKLISKRYADEQRARINPSWYERSPATWGQDEVAITVEGPGLPQNDSGTAHLSVVDKWGNAVSITKTINTPFGSGITVPGTGVVLNNEMDDFAVAPDTPNSYGLVDTSGANAVAPLKRPLSSMTPTIITKNGAPLMVTGSPGGPRIISTVLLTILNVVDYGMNVQQAVSAPRFHHQWVPNKIVVEPEFPADVIEGLEARGHTVERSKRHWSSAQAIFLDHAGRMMFGGSDPRTDGLAAGY